ncbi:aminotransferase-like mobile domain-containing protein [Tanacetum coccineum]
MDVYDDVGIDVESEKVFGALSNIFFPSSSNVVVKSLCKVSGYLARGVRLAIALTVLASVYKDSRFLKVKIVLSDAMSVIVQALLQLVQIWTWESFPKISPKCEIGCNLKFAKWEKTNVCVDDVGSFVDHLMNLFQF